MSKFEKGILGYRKDPKNQILFSFGVRPGEEWPSDDSEDSDYSPGTKNEAPRPPTVKTTKKPRKDAKSKRGRSSVESSNSEDESAQSDSSDTIIESTIISECNINKNLNRSPTPVKSSQNSVHLKGQKLTAQTVSKAKQESVSLSPSGQNTVLDATEKDSANHVSPSASSHPESGFSETSSSCLESTQGSPPTAPAAKKEKKSEKAKRKKHKLPSLEEESSHKKKKRKRERKEGNQSKPPRRRRCKAAAVAPVQYKEGQEGISTAQNLPPEILLKIFRLVVAKQGAIPFLCRAARVCKLWYHTSCNPSLWMNLDLSYGWIKSQERYLIWLSTHRIPLCTSINLTGWKLLTFNGIQALAESCPNLTSINLSQCSKITSKAVQLLADHCSMLTRIDLSATSTEAVSQVTLKYLLERVGKSVTHLTLGNNTLKGFNSVLNCISTHCPNLEYLDVSSVFFSSDYLAFNVEKFQQGCPKLRTLRFVDAKVRASQATQREQVESPGFPDLEELSIAVNTNKNTYRLAMDGDALSRLLKNSSQLKTLDVRGWSFYSYRALIHIPATDVQQLLISQNHVPISQDFGFDLVMQKWRHSLVEVDLSWNSYRDDVLDQGLQILTEFRDECVVEVLDLAGTNVECATVRTILNRCPRLRAVNLSSCRSLPRGIKREFEGAELQGLRVAVEKFEKEES